MGTIQCKDDDKRGKIENEGRRDKGRAKVEERKQKKLSLLDKMKCENDTLKFTRVQNYKSGCTVKLHRIQFNGLVVPFTGYSTVYR